MKTYKRLGKKVLSVFMAVLMIMTAWVFVAPEHNHVQAAGNGQYTITLNFTINDAADNGGHAYIYYYPFKADGSGVDTSARTQYSGSEFGSMFKTSTTSYSATIPGWPCEVFVQMNAERFGTDNVVLTSIVINSTTVMAGTYTFKSGWGNATNQTKTFKYDKTGGSEGSPTTWAWAVPTPTTASKSLSGTHTLTIPKDDTTAQTTTLFEAEWKDQYGNEWPSAPVYTVSNSNLIGIKTSGDGAYVTTTKNAFAQLSGSSYKAANGYVDLTLTAAAYSGSGKTSSCTIRLWSPKIYVKFYDEDGTTLLKDASGYYGATVTAPTATKASDDEYKYTFSKWLSTDGTDTAVPGTFGSDDLNFKAVYTSTAHVYETYEQYNSTQHYYVCKNCGYKKLEDCPQHEYIEIDGDDTYHIKKCVKCLKETNVSHDYAHNVTANSCTTGGYTTSTCKVCGHVWEHDYTSATGHDFTGAAVANNDGTHSYKCVNSGCSAKGTGTTEGGKENCSYGGIQDSYNGSTHYKQCSVCNYENHIAHDWQDVVSTEYYTGVDATCITGKQYYKSCACGATNYDATFYDTDINATNHSYAVENGELQWTEAVEPGCLTDGNYEYWYCPDCGIYSKDAMGNDPSNWYENLEATIAPAIGHKFNNADYVSNGDATCLADGTETAECANGCGKTATRTDVGSKLEHSFTNYIPNNNPTCTTSGTMTATCDYDAQWGCGATHTVDNPNDPALDHSFTQYIFNNDAKCEEDGTMTAKCDRCNATDTKTFPGSAKGHSFTVQNPTDYYLATKVTCENAATYYYACANGCDAKGSETYAYGAPLGHDYDVDNDGDVDTDDGVVTEEPKCITNGVRTYTCQNDNSHTYTEVIPALGHKDDDNDNHCDNCGAELCSHTGYETYVDGYAPADCTTPGFSGDKRCENCDEIIEAGAVIPALGHTFTEQIQDDAHLKSKANCVAADTYYYDCISCDVMANDTIENGTYTVGDPDTLNGHVWQTYDPAVDASSIISEATCQALAVYASYCPVCNGYATKAHLGIANATFTYGELADHKFENYISDGNATCQKDGTKTAVCSFGCGKAKDTQPDVGSQLEHDFTNPSKNQVTSNANGTHKVVCKTCKASDGEVASITVDCSAADATCTEDSVCVCGYKLHDALGHNFDTTIKENINPKDENDPEKYPVAGNFEHVIKCSRCDETEVVKCVYEKEVVAPTCTERGYTSYTCPICGGGYSGTYVPATGHTWESYDPGEDTTYRKSEATCLSAAIYYSVCKDCDTYATEENAGEKNYTFTVGDPLEHVFTDNYVYNDDDTHSILCDLNCGTKTEAEACDYADGVITEDKRPSEIGAKGEITYECQICEHIKAVEVERAYYVDYLEARYLIGTLLAYAEDLTDEAKAALNDVLATYTVAENLIDCGHAYSQTIIDEYVAALEAIYANEDAEDFDADAAALAVEALHEQLCGKTDAEAGTKACTEQCEILWAIINMKYTYNKYKGDYKEYKVQFVVDGEVVKEETVTSGGAATAPTETPTKDPDGTYHYTFLKWNKAFDVVKDNLVVTAVFDDEAHVGGKATCEAKAVCTECKASYGEKLEHSYTGEFVDNGDGTHKIMCVNGCEEYSENEEHFGGTATCTAKAVCEICSAEYGTLAEHVYDKEVAEETYLKSVATCQNKAVYYLSCVCGKKIEVAEDSTEGTFEYGELDADNHTKLEDVNGKEATCIEEGYKAYKLCTDCGTEVGYEVIPVAGHKFTVNADKDKNDESTIKTEATCEADAVYYKVCSVCKVSAKNIDKTATWVKDDSQLEHEYGTVVTYGGKNAEGKHIHIKKCINCQTPVTAECTNEVIAETDSTCKTAGYKTYQCKDCHNTFKEKKTLDLNNHEGAEKLVGYVEATCVAGGYSGDVHCSSCNTKLRDGEDTEIDENNHAGKVTIPQVDATCQTTGKEAYDYCEDCDTTLTVGAEIPVKAHKYTTYISNGDGTHTATCATCVEDADKGLKKATDTDDCSGGSANCVAKAVCDVCDTEYGELDNTKHKTEKTYSKVDSTCQTEGHETYKHCIACDTDTTKKVIIKTKDHKFGTPTSNGDGTHTATCMTCKTSVGTPATQVKACSGGEATCTTKAKCAECYSRYGSVDPTNHAKTSTKLVGKKEATCTTAGYTGDEVHTCCYDSSKTIAEQPNAVAKLGEAIPVVGHVYNVEYTVVPGTCQAEGYIIYSCKCGDISTEKTTLPINPKNHHKSDTITVGDKDATCEEDGYTGDVYYVCCYSDEEGADNSNALKSKGEVIDSNGAGGHDYTGVTPVSDGLGRHEDGKWYHTYKCVRCSETKTEACYTYEHTYNCVDTDICAVCGGACSTVDSTSHKSALVKVDEVPATCAETGIKAYYECKDCGLCYFDASGSREITEENAKELIIPVSTKHSIDRNATPKANNNGTHTYTCSIDGCGATVVENCSGGKATCTDKAECQHCSAEYGELDAANHSKGTITEGRVEPDGCKPGVSGKVKYECCGTVVFEGDVLPGDGKHSWTETSDKVDNCTVSYTVTKTCSHCGEVEKVNYSGFDHTTDKVVYSTANSCTVDREVYYACSLCGYTDKTVEIEGKTYNYLTKETVKAAGECKYGPWTTTVKSSCVVEGIREKVCTVCGSKVTESLGYADHILITEEGQDATCDLPGTADYTYCVVEGCEYNKGGTPINPDKAGQEIPASGHGDYNGDGWCDGCGGTIEVNPDNSRCGCICHKQNGFMQLIYKILRFFWKLFGINKACSANPNCVHY